MKRRSHLSAIHRFIFTCYFERLLELPGKFKNFHLNSGNWVYQQTIVWYRESVFSPAIGYNFSIVMNVSCKSCTLLM